MKVFDINRFLERVSELGAQKSESDRPSSPLMGAASA
jgi:hypothetical protein